MSNLLAENTCEKGQLVFWFSNLELISTSLNCLTKIFWSDMQVDQNLSRAYQKIIQVWSQPYQNPIKIRSKS